MTELSISELQNVEVVEGHGGDNQYLVRVDEGDYKSVPKSGKVAAAIRTSFFDRCRYSGDGEVMVYMDGSDLVLKHDDGRATRVPSDKEEHVYWSIHDSDDARLEKLFEEEYTPTVRQGVMDWFMPRFRQDDSIEKTDDGWLVEDDVLVRWDGTNEIARETNTHVVRGGSTKQSDVGRTALDIDFHIPDSTNASTPDGRSVELDDVEMKFLVTAAYAVEADPNPSMYDDDLTGAILDSHVDAFTDAKSGLRHGHSKKKHQVSDLGVTQEAIDRLYYNSYDHGGVVEMAYREQEFRNAPFDVFDHASNDDATMWRKINSTKEKAPVPQEVHQNLSEMYE